MFFKNFTFIFTFNDLFIEALFRKKIFQNIFNLNFEIFLVLKASLLSLSSQNRTSLKIWKSLDLKNCRGPFIGHFLN